MSTNFAKTLVWKQDYDVKLWRHKQHTPNTNDYPMPLNETPPWKFSAYATVFHRNFTGVTWGCCPWVTVCQSLLSWQRADTNFHWLQLLIVAVVLSDLLFFQQSWFYVQELVVQANLPVTITWQNCFFRRQVNVKLLMITLTLHMIVIEPAQCMLNRNK